MFEQSFLFLHISMLFLILEYTVFMIQKLTKQEVFREFGLKVKVTVTLYPCFFHNSLLISLLWISALLSPIELNFFYVTLICPR